MRIRSSERMLYAVGADATAGRGLIVTRMASPADWPLIFSGREIVPVPPAVYAVWTQAHHRPITEDALIAALDGDGPPLRSLTHDHPVFTRWPWVDNGGLPLSADDVCLCTAGVPNPDPLRIPAAVWGRLHSVAALEAACQATGATAAVRWGLMEAIPHWLATRAGLRLQLAPAPEVFMVFAGVDHATGAPVDRAALLRLFAANKVCPRLRWCRATFKVKGVSRPRNKFFTLCARQRPLHK